MKIYHAQARLFMNCKSVCELAFWRYFYLQNLGKNKVIGVCHIIKIMNWVNMNLLTKSQNI